MRWYVQDEVNQEESDHNEVDGMKKGAENRWSYKPVDELARVLPSFKRPLLSVDVTDDMYDSIERYPVQPC